MRKESANGFDMDTELQMKRKVLEMATSLNMLSAMGMNRHQRRGLAKANGVKKITGSMKPFVKNS